MILCCLRTAVRYCVIYILAANFIPVYSQSWLEDAHFVTNLEFTAAKCIRVNEALSDENNVHAIVCQGCHLLHLKLTRTNSVWEKAWIENLAQATECGNNDADHIQDAIFLPAGRNAANVLYLSGAVPRVTNLRYRISSSESQQRKIMLETTTRFSSRDLRICTGLHNYNIPHYYSTVLIAGSSNSEPSIYSLNTHTNRTTRLRYYNDKPYSFSADPSNYTNIFVITSNGLKRLVFDGNQYDHTDTLMEGVSGTKVLAITSTDILILPNRTKEGVVSLKLNRRSKRSEMNPSTHLTNHTFTGLDLHALSETIFLLTEDKLYYNVTSNTTQPTAPPTTPTTTRITTTNPTTRKPVQVKTTPTQNVNTPLVRTQNPKTFSTTVDPWHSNIIVISCSAVACAIVVMVVITIVLCTLYKKNKRHLPKNRDDLVYSAANICEEMKLTYDFASVVDESGSGYADMSGYSRNARCKDWLKTSFVDDKAQETLFENNINETLEKQRAHVLHLDPNDLQF